MYLIIYNPVAGKRDFRSRQMIVDYFEEYGLDYNFIETTIEKGPIEILEEHSDKEYEAVLSCGGDGTISETIQGLQNADLSLPLLIVPLGTTNEMSQNFSFDDLNLSEVLDKIKDQKTLSIDYGLINGHKTFMYALSFGNFTEVTYKTPQNLKNWLGYRAYILYGLLSFRRISSYKLKIKCKEKRIEGEFVFGAISNSKSMGNIIYFDPESFSLSDGSFEVFLIKKPKNIKELRNILKGMLFKSYDSSMFIRFQTEKLMIESQKQISLNVDGEFGGKRNAIYVENKKQSLRLIV